MAELDSALWTNVAAGIHNSGRQLVIAATGGGSGAISVLLQTPGASRSVLEALVPYAWSALVDLLGTTPEQACSEVTARAMAMAAYVRAQRLAPDADPEMLVGIGCTASLASDRPKRGQRRIHVAMQGVRRTAVFSLVLADENAKRQHDECVATNVLLHCIATACQDDSDKLGIALLGAKEGLLTVDAADEGSARELISGNRPFVVLEGELPRPVVDLPPEILFPGSFNPPHAGHLRMAEIAERRLGKPVTWELSIANVDKPPLDFIAIRDRRESLHRSDPSRLVAITLAPTFREKAALFPGSTFVVGADTIVRIGDPRYYGGDARDRDAAIAEIAAGGCRFLVFGRQYEGRFQSLGELELPPELRAICDEVPASEFREDVSSTQLRAVGGV